MKSRSNPIKNYLLQNTDSDSSFRDRRRWRHDGRIFFASCDSQKKRQKKSQPNPPSLSAARGNSWDMSRVHKSHVNLHTPCSAALLSSVTFHTKTLPEGRDTLAARVNLAGCQKRSGAFPFPANWIAKRSNPLINLRLRLLQRPSVLL